MKFPYRYIARITLEATTPLAVGSDTFREDLDSPVAKDFNNLPYIPGTALAGWLRHKMEKFNPEILPYFGDEPGRQEDEETRGSNLIFSDALLMGKDGKVVQQIKDLSDDDFFSRFYDLPVRQHVAIDYRGTAKEGNLFDREVVYKGSRFKFEIALELENPDDEAWKRILQAFAENDLHLGGGEFDGFGELKIVEIQEARFDLQKELDDFLKITVDLNNDEGLKPAEIPEFSSPIFIEDEYMLTGMESFHHFGAGYGDMEVDHINYKEEIIVWENGKPNFKEMFVMPGTSIKGALAHRVAYHYNKEQGNTVEKILEDYFNRPLPEEKEALENELSFLNNIIKERDFEKMAEDYLYENNPAVADLFGTAKNSKTGKGRSGKVIIKDTFLDGNMKEHIFYHNKIDRFTGGTVAGALYSEKVLHIHKTRLHLKIKKETDKTYLRKALNDLLNGTLPVGGMVNKGHGIFKQLKTNNHE